jgi:hypothetical protein
MSSSSTPRPEVAELVRTPGRFRGETRVTLATAGGERARGLWFDGRPGDGGRPWVELEDAGPAMLAAVARLLPPGASIMVAYGPGEMERSLRRRVPPAATPLGLALLGAGCRRLKDWYFAEGGREGHAKLQGELPLDAAHRRAAERALSAELEAFLATGDGTDADRRRAREALALIASTAPRSRVPR